MPAQKTAFVSHSLHVRFSKYELQCMYTSVWGLLWRGKPLLRRCILSKAWEIPTTKNQCVWELSCACVCVCVSRFCKTNLSSMCRFSAIEPGFDHSATVNNAMEVTAHLQQRMLAFFCARLWPCVCLGDRATWRGFIQAASVTEKLGSTWPS